MLRFMSFVTWIILGIVLNSLGVSIMQMLAVAALTALIAFLTGIRIVHMLYSEAKKRHENKE